MNNILEYKGYYTRIEYSSEDKSLYGKIEGIVDLVTFESADATTIEVEFHNAVDDYLEFCAEVGKEPDKSYKGSFNVRISPTLHKELAIKAFKNNESLNQTVENAIKYYLKSLSDVYTELCVAMTKHYNYEEIYTTSINLWNNYKPNIPNKIISYRDNVLCKKRDETEGRYVRY